MRINKEVEANKYKIKCGKSTYRIFPDNTHNNISIKFIQTTVVVDNKNSDNAEIAQTLNGENKNGEISSQGSNKVFVEPQEKKSSDFKKDPREDGSKIIPEIRVFPKRRNFKCSKCNIVNHHYASRCPSGTPDSNNAVVGDNAADRTKSVKSEKNINQIDKNTTDENISAKTVEKSTVLGTTAKKPEKVLKNQVDFTVKFSKRRTFTCGKCGIKNEHYKSKCPETAKECNDNSADGVVDGDGATIIRNMRRAKKNEKTIKNPDWKNVSIREEHKNVLVKRALKRFRDGPTKKEGEGYIYILKYTYTGENKKKLEEARKFANLLKVGMSMDVTKRIGKLEYDNNLEREHECYTKIFEFEVKWRYIVDQMIKEQLKGTLEQYCPPLVGNGGTEWYKGSKEEIITIIESVLHFMDLYAPDA